MGMKIAGVGGEEVEVGSRNALRTYSDYPGAGYRAVNISGTMAAALGGNTVVWSCRMDPAATTTAAIIHGVSVRFVALTAFTTPVNGNRWLSIYKGTATGNTSGGSDITGDKIDSAAASPRLTSSGGGSMRMSTTGALTAGASTAYNGFPLGIEALADVGNAGNSKAWTWGKNERGGPEGAPLCVLRAGEILAIRNINAMDAAGTWQFVVDVWWSEVPVTALTDL